LDTACKKIAAACVVMSERSVDFCHMHGVITQTEGIFVTTMRTTNFTTF